VDLKLCKVGGDQSDVGALCMSLSIFWCLALVGPRWSLAVKGGEGSLKMQSRW
jgi:hypothetical protein